MGEYYQSELGLPKNLEVHFLAKAKFYEEFRQFSNSQPEKQRELLNLFWFYIGHEEHYTLLPGSIEHKRWRGAAGYGTWKFHAASIPDPSIKTRIKDPKDLGPLLSWKFSEDDWRGYPNSTADKLINSAHDTFTHFIESHLAQ
jgi:hypothetical protein